MSAKAPAKKPAKPAPIDLNAKIVLPNFQGTVADLLNQVRAEKQTATGTGKRAESIKQFLNLFWSKGGRGTSKELTAMAKTVAKSVGIAFTPYTAISRGYLLRIKEKGLMGFYVISTAGTEFAGIDTSKLAATVAPSPQTSSQSIATALESVQ